MPLDDDTRRCVALLVGATIIIVVYASMLAYASCFEKVAQHTSILRGQQWLDELCEGHPRRFKNEIRMSKYVFNRLSEVLQEDGRLKDTWYVTVQEQLAIFLHLAHQVLSNRTLQEHFQHSLDTISK